MKKISVLLLSMVLIFSSSAYSFAANAKEEIIKVNLGMTTSQEDIEFIKAHTEEDESALSSDNNTFTMNITKVKEDKESSLLSGNVVAKVFGRMQMFSFEDQRIDIKSINGKPLYTGIIEADIDEKHTVLLGLTATQDFKSTITSLTIVNLETDSQQIMLYGDTFAEQVQLCKQEYETVQLMQKEEEALALATEESETETYVDEDDLGTFVAQAEDKKSKYQHVMKLSISVGSFFSNSLLRLRPEENRSTAYA